MIRVVSWFCISGADPLFLCGVGWLLLACILGLVGFGLGLVCLAISLVCLVVCACLVVGLVLGLRLFVASGLLIVACWLMF